MSKNNIIIALLMLLSSSVSYLLGTKVTQHSYFSEHTEKYLGDYKLDIPEELTAMKDLDDREPEYLFGIRDAASKIIYIGFDPRQGRRFSNIKWADEMTSHYEYQIGVNLGLDSMDVYDGNRLIGSVKYSHSQLDSLFEDDNQ